ncbi:hypothetical protein K0T92_21730 [Paenibacillus oenotherae]|uniref:GHMP kinase n=1 Tax=Paenibacillus oenotherae TaxID=1435645 RepID=A0ABS7DBN7_9BACL|nr:hypothetical protein [Paenibacillus oenotherae]MBW7477344.1 hypothetical protein [Paenibacillus oenotherae]
MIISQTPLRVSFFGGGTDLKDYYRFHGGAVLSSTIDKYIYVIVKSRYDDRIVLNYAKKEEVRTVAEIEHPIIREALTIVGIDQGIEITSISDIPSEGSGLGSSSSFTIGLLNALYMYKGETKNPHELGAIACRIEIDLLKEPIGKQDQYAAAFGGFKKYSFNSDDTVSVDSIPLTNSQYKLLDMHAMMFFTGITRKASAVLADQKQNTGNNLDTLNRLKQFVDTCHDDFLSLNIERIGRLLDVSWEEKKKLSRKINNNEIDRIYEAAKEAGIYGGKLLGAGGGGFFLFLCPLENQQRVRQALHHYDELPISFDRYGSRIVLNANDHCGFVNLKVGC